MTKTELEFEEVNGIEYYYNLAQLSDEWMELKLGMLSASQLKNVITAKTLKISASEKSRLFYDDILSQRIDGEINRDGYFGWDMQRGLDDEEYAVKQYEKEYGDKITRCGFVINRKNGFNFGWSPDGLIDDDGSIEIKSRVPKYQIQTILDHVCGRTEDPVPTDFMMQLQGGLYCSERKYVKFISFCNGNPMVTIDVEPIAKFQDKIHEAVTGFEKVLKENHEKYLEAVKDPRLTPTPRRKINTGDIKT